MSFPRYPAYKPSGVEWLGEVPEHWNRTALKFLADYQNGYPFKPDERGETGLPIIRISQLTGDDEPAYYSGTLDERVKVRNGDLLFSWSATIDSYIWNKGEAWLNQHIFRVSPSKEADKRYLYYAIKHVAPKLADFDAHGSTMRHIKKESLGEKIYVPLVFDQGLIATFLDRETAKIDALIAEQQRLIELLQEKRQAVISHAVTKGLNPDALMKDSGVEWLGEVPEHWIVMPLRLAARIESGHTPSRSREDYWVAEECVYPWFTLGDVWQIRDGMTEYVFETQEKVSQIGLENSAARLLPANTVILSRTASVGFSGILGAAMATTQDFVNWICGPRISPEYLLYVFRAMVKEFERLKYGSTHNTIYMPDIFSFRAPVPPLDEQREIVSMVRESLRQLDGSFDDLLKSQELLQERRSALISAAVTGQIDVRGLVAEASAA